MRFQVIHSLNWPFPFVLMVELLSRLVFPFLHKFEDLHQRLCEDHHYDRYFDGFICFSYLWPEANAAAPAPTPTATSSAQPRTGITSGSRSIGLWMQSRAAMMMKVP